MLQIIENLEGLENLENLYLGKNKITNIQRLDSLKKLSILSLQVMTNVIKLYVELLKVIKYSIFNCNFNFCSNNYAR